MSTQCNPKVKPKTDYIYPPAQDVILNTFDNFHKRFACTRRLSGLLSEAGAPVGLLPGTLVLPFPRTLYLGKWRGWWWQPPYRDCDNSTAFQGIASFSGFLWQTHSNTTRYPTKANPPVVQSYPTCQQPNNAIQPQMLGS